MAGGGIQIDFTRNEEENQNDNNNNNYDNNNSNNKNNDGYRTITLTGTQDQIQIAQQLMSKCVQSSEKLQQRVASSKIEQGLKQDYSPVNPVEQDYTTQQLTQSLYVPWTQS